MAHKKGQGSTRNVRDSNPQYRGIKLYGGQRAKPGNVIVRQCGTKFRPGFNVRIGRDDTLFAVAEGSVVYQTHPGRRHTVHVDPAEPETPRPQWLREYRVAQAAG